MYRETSDERTTRWDGFDIGALDLKLRVLEAQLESRSPVRWDPFHYEPFMYEVLNTLLLGELCGKEVLRWQCDGEREQGDIKG